MGIAYYTKKHSHMVCQYQTDSDHIPHEENSPTVGELYVLLHVGDAENDVKDTEVRHMDEARMGDGARALIGLVSSVADTFFLFVDDVADPYHGALSLRHW
jgi:hypothetical protein